MVFLICFCVVGGMAAADGPSLVWVERSDLSEAFSPTILADLGEATIAEIESSGLISLDNAGIDYELIDLDSSPHDYWLVEDMRTQGFDVVRDLAEILKIHGNVALIKGDRKLIEERIPGLGYELRRLFRHTPRSPREPVLGRGGFGDILEQVSVDSVESHIRWLESFGTRYSYAYGCTLAGYGLYDKFQQYGLQVDYFSFPFDDPGAGGFNVVATLPGVDLPDLVYIICGHYDSISNDPRVSAPGADDNASGTAAVIEAARVLKDLSPRATIKFICWSGEEQGLYGSWYYAGYADSIGMNIGGVLNFDMIGYCDVEGLFDVDVHTDENSEPLADLILAEGQALGTLLLNRVMGGGGSDHVPFWIYGYPAIFAIERATDHWNPYYHSTADTAGTLTMPFATEIVKMGVAGLLRLARFFPEVSFYDYEWDDSGGDRHADPGDTLTVRVSLLNSGKSASSVEATLSSDNPFVTIIDSVSDYGDVPSDSIKDNSTDPFLVAVDPSAPLHVCTLHVAIEADSLHFSGDFPIMIGIPSVLLVDADGGDSYETWFAGSLERTGVLFDVLTDQGDVTGSYLSDYETLVFLTGDNSTPLDSSELRALSDYLDSGGNLFVSGQDVEACVDSSFLENYLHAEVVEDSTTATRIFGYAGDPIGDGMRFFIAGVPGAFNQVTPSIISPIGGADSVFYYWEGGCSGVRYADTYNVVYLPYGFEAISPWSAADTVMMRTLRWFGLPVGLEEEVIHREPVSTTRFLGTQPNPFRQELEIEYFVATPSMLTLRVYDTAGRMVNELVRELKTPGVHHVTWDGRNPLGSRVPQGVYFLHLSDGNEDRVEKCILLK
jgi:hypothetical protein